MRETLVAGSLPGYAPEVGAALWRLEDARDRTLRLLADVPWDLVDRSVSGNTIGTILYHVALIEADWLFSEILEAELPADLAARFPADDRDAQGILTAVHGESVDDHRARLAAVRAELLARLRGMDDVAFHQVRKMPSYDVSPAWVLHHLAQHEAEHRAEVGAVLTAQRG